MRNRLNIPTVLGSVAALAAVLLFSPVARAQRGQTAQPRQQGGANQGQRRGAAPSPTANLPFDPHDLTGVWRFGGGLAPDNVPPMTPEAKAKFDANIPGLGGPEGKNQPLGNDPMMTCDPVGYPRVLTFGAYPMEMVQLPGRIIQFFDYFYVHRTIWMDGRKLPDDPEPTWYGYAIGHWEGDTLVVESNGYNGRAWFANGGYPYSEDARLEERYKRMDHDTINITMTLTDPAMYTKPWMLGPWSLRWRPGVMREDVCAPSDEQKYLEEIRQPAARKPGQ
jgi:hypothetical protein